MTILVADVGGTWSRCALGRGLALIGEPVVLRNAGFAGLGELLGSFLEGLPETGRPTSAALAIAAPVGGDEVRMTNIGWSFSQGELRRQLALDRLQVVNDFEAVAWSLPLLQAGDLAAVGNGRSVAHGPRVAIGAGTGLGIAGLVQNGRVAVGGEGGHGSLAAQDEVEERVIRLARECFGHCSAERVLSGAGLGFLHHALHGGPQLTAAEIGSRFDAGDAAAQGTLEQFFRFLGSVAGDAALTFAATGGVYIAGGIVPRYLDALRRSAFRERFESKGRYRAYLAPIPTVVITASNPALRGLLALSEGQPG